MKTVQCYGHSDDLAELRCDKPEMDCDDEYDIFNDRAEATLIRESDSAEGLVVTWQYTAHGTWSIGIAPLWEGVELPDWPMKWELDPRNGPDDQWASKAGRPRPRYSTLLTLTVPDDVYATRLYPPPDEED